MSRLRQRVARTLWPHRQPSVRGNPRGDGFPGSKRAEIVNRPIGPDDLHAPDAANLRGQQDRGRILGWFILWCHRQNKQIRPMKLRNGATRAAPRRLTPAFRLRCPQRSRSRRGWVATLLGAILLFGDKNLFPHVRDEFDRNCGQRRVQLRRAGN